MKQWAIWRKRGSEVAHIPTAKHEDTISRTAIDAATVGVVVTSTVDPIIRTREGFRLLGISKSTGYNHIRQGLLPPLVRVGPRCTGWRRSVLQNYIDNLPTKK